MGPFYGWASTVSRLQSQHKETVYFLPLSKSWYSFDWPWKDGRLSWPWSHSLEGLSPSKFKYLFDRPRRDGRWKPELTLEAPIVFVPGTRGLEIQCPNQLKLLWIRSCFKILYQSNCQILYICKILRSESLIMLILFVLIDIQEKMNWL